MTFVHEVPPGLVFYLMGRYWRREADYPPELVCPLCELIESTWRLDDKEIGKHYYIIPSLLVDVPGCDAVPYFDTGRRESRYL